MAIILEKNQIYFGGKFELKSWLSYYNCTVSCFHKDDLIKKSLKKIFETAYLQIQLYFLKSLQWIDFELILKSQFRFLH
jgi:hypothetical protein